MRLPCNFVNVFTKSCKRLLNVDMNTAANNQKQWFSVTIIALSYAVTLQSVTASSRLRRQLTQLTTQQPLIKFLHPVIA